MLAPLKHHDRVQRFGEFQWVWDPTPTNPEHIHIQGGWAEINIANVHMYPLGRSVNLHYKAVKPFQGWLEELEREGLLHELGHFDGSWAQRFVRQSGSMVQRKAACAVLAKRHDSAKLSNHAWGTALDFDAKRYPLGVPVPANDVRHELARLAEHYGIGWGGHYTARPDGMHFELVG